MKHVQLATFNLCAFSIAVSHTEYMVLTNATLQKQTQNNYK